MPLDHKLLTTKFEGLKNKQDKIQVLSLFLIHNRKHVKSITEVWIKVVKKSPISHRLTLLYLANDVVQHSKKKGHISLVDGFQKVIADSVPFLSDPSIKPSVSRVFSIWVERSIYPVAFIVDLKKKLGEGNPLKESAITAKIVAEYKLSTLLDSIKRVSKVEEDVKNKISRVNNSNITKLSNQILAGLKDKSVAEELTNEFDEASVVLMAAINSLEEEVCERRKLLDELSKSLVYYVIQGKEVEQLSCAYRKLGSNVTLIKKRKSGQFVASSPFDVPSPSDSDDGPILPSDNAKNDTAATMSNAPMSTLDQRLTLLMQGALESGVAPPQSINPNFRPPAVVVGTPNKPSSTSGQGQEPSTSGQQSPEPKIQTIQSVITPRTDQDLIQSTDMDITNSDEEECVDEYTPRLPPLPQRAINPENIIPLNANQGNRGGNFSNNHGNSNNNSNLFLPPPIPRSVVIPASNTFIPHHGHPSPGHGHPSPGHGHLQERIHHHPPPMSQRSVPNPWTSPPPPPPPSMDSRNSRGPQRPLTPERISRMVSQYRSAASSANSGKGQSANKDSRREGW